MFITETWLYTDVSSGLLDPKSRYVILRKDSSSKGGGVSAFVKRTMNIVAIDMSTAFSTLEVVCYDVMFSSCDKLRFLWCIDPTPLLR